MLTLPPPPPPLFDTRQQGLHGWISGSSPYHRLTTLETVQVLALAEAVLVVVAVAAAQLVSALVDRDSLLVTERSAQQRETVKG